jgi:hypothetical protein
VNWIYNDDDIFTFGENKREFAVSSMFLLHVHDFDHGALGRIALESCLRSDKMRDSRTCSVRERKEALPIFYSNHPAPPDPPGVWLFGGKTGGGGDLAWLPEPFEAN